LGANLHPATAVVSGRAGSRVQNLLGRIQTQVESRPVQRTIVDINVRGRVQQVAANHGGIRSSVYISSEGGSAASEIAQLAAHGSALGTGSLSTAGRRSRSSSNAAVEASEGASTPTPRKLGTSPVRPEDEVSSDAVRGASVSQSEEPQPTQRRRMRQDHLARCINLQHGMLRESRVGGVETNDNLLSRRVAC
jgi:hypothetical protein